MTFIFLCNGVFLSKRPPAITKLFCGTDTEHQKDRAPSEGFCFVYKKYILPPRTKDDGTTPWTGYVNIVMR